MKVQIGKQGRNITLHIPTGLVLNRFVLGLVLDTAGEALPVSGKDTARILEEINRIRKKNGPWRLVEVSSADGDHVTVTV